MDGVSAVTVIGTLVAPDAPVVWFYGGGSVAERDWMRAGEVARVFKVDRSTIHRLPKDVLPYTETPGGGQRRQRRYLKADVYRYARDVLGIADPERSDSPAGPSTPTD